MGNFISSTTGEDEDENSIRHKLENLRRQLRTDIQKKQHDLDNVNKEIYSLEDKIYNERQNEHMCTIWASEIFILNHRQREYCQSVLSNQQLINDIEKTLTIHNEEQLLERYGVILKKMSEATMVNSLVEVKAKTAELKSFADYTTQIDVTSIIETVLIKKSLPAVVNNNKNENSTPLYIGITREPNHQ